MFSWQVGKSYIVDEILSALQDLGNAVQNRDVDDSFLETDESGYFVSRIDQVNELHYENLPMQCTEIFIPRHLKKCGVLCCTLQKKLAFECPSVRPSALHFRALS